MLSSLLHVTNATAILTRAHVEGPPLVAHVEMARLVSQAEEFMGQAWVVLPGGVWALANHSLHP